MFKYFSSRFFKSKVFYSLLIILLITFTSIFTFSKRDVTSRIKMPQRKVIPILSLAKDSVFRFKNTIATDVLKKISEHYVIEIEYRGKKPTSHHTGVISYNTNLKEIIEMLNASGIHAEYLHNKIVVRP